MLSGDNGILQKATTAKENTDNSQIQERINLAYHSALVDGKGKVTVIGPTKKTISKVSIPDSFRSFNINFEVTGIGGKAFTNCKKLKAVSIGKNITVIGSKSFAKSKKLKKIIIKGIKLKKVGSKAFSGIYKKAVIKVPKKKLKVYKKLLKGKGQKKTVKIK